MRLRPVTLVLACALPLLLAAHGPARTTLQGRVVDASTQLFVEGAAVTLVPASLLTRTDVGGGFSFEDVDLSAADTLVVVHDGCVTARVPLGSIEDDAWTIRVRLQPSGRPVGPDADVSDPLGGR